MDNFTRRDVMKTSAGFVATLAAASRLPARLAAAVRAARHGSDVARLRSAVIGINHGRINSQVDATAKGGGEFVSFYAKEPELRAAFAKRYPNVKVAKD